MIVYKVIANRQLSEYSGSDKYINITKNNTFQEIFSSTLDFQITTINHKPINQETKGNTTNIHFEIEDIILKEYFDVFFAKGSRELRLQLTKYVDFRKVIPGDLITIIIERNENNCNMKIKSESIYRYVLERKSKNTDRYRIFIEYPKENNNAGITVSEHTDAHLAFFNIQKLDEAMRFGKAETKFSTYKLEGCTSDYIGVPHNRNLECDFFDTIEEII